MAKHLKLVKPVQRAERPYGTDYYDSTHMRDSSYIRTGHASTEAGAIRAAVVRVFLGEYRMAVIHEEGAIIYTITRTARGITINFGRAGAREAAA